MYPPLGRNLFTPTRRISLRNPYGNALFLDAVAERYILGRTGPKFLTLLDQYIDAFVGVDTRYRVTSSPLAKKHIVVVRTDVWCACALCLAVYQWRIGCVTGVVCTDGVMISVADHGLAGAVHS